jgi:hypothetical protein
MLSVWDIYNKRKTQLWEQLRLESMVFPVALNVIQKEIPQIQKHQLYCLKKGTIIIRICDSSLRKEFFLRKKKFQNQINSIIGSEVVRYIDVI